MRLICPNCGAQYEVPEDVIPDEGRDVQCSNCGDTWYQPSARMLAQGATRMEEPQVAFATGGPDYDYAEEEPEEEDAPWPEAPAPEPEDAGADWAEDPDAPEAEEDDDDLDAAAEFKPEFEPEAEPEEEVAAEEPQKRRLDPEISRVLREEALREVALRSGRSENLETQTELGLEEPSSEEMQRRARQSQDRMARMRGAPPAPPPRLDAPSRRGLLPDIDAVNHSLSPGQTPPPPVREAEEPTRKKSGFSRGFFLVILLALLGMLVYSKAPAIAAKVPQADPYLSSYVAMVDQARFWLDAKAKALAAD